MDEQNSANDSLEDVAGGWSDNDTDSTASAVVLAGLLSAGIPKYRQMSARRSSKRAAPEPDGISEPEAAPEPDIVSDPEVAPAPEVRTDRSVEQATWKPLDRPEVKPEPPREPAVYSNTSQTVEHRVERNGRMEVGAVTTKLEGEREGITIYPGTDIKTYHSKDGDMTVDSTGKLKSPPVEIGDPWAQAAQPEQVIPQLDPPQQQVQEEPVQVDVPQQPDLEVSQNQVSRPGNVSTQTDLTEDLLPPGD